jgi:hypothetical protein
MNHTSQIAKKYNSSAMALQSIRCAVIVALLIPLFGFAETAPNWSLIEDLSSNTPNPGFKNNFEAWIIKVINSCDHPNLKPQSSYDILGLRLGDLCLLPEDYRKAIASQIPATLENIEDITILETLRSGSATFPSTLVHNEDELKIHLLIFPIEQKIYVAKITRTIMDRPGYISLQPDSSFSQSLVKKYGTPAGAVTGNNEAFEFSNAAREDAKREQSKASTRNDAQFSKNKLILIESLDQLAQKAASSTISQYFWKTKDPWSDQTIIIANKYSSKITITLWTDLAASQNSFLSKKIDGAFIQMQNEILKHNNKRKIPAL